MMGKKIFSIVVLCLCVSCDGLREGKQAISDSIDESKEMNVFQAEYIVNELSFNGRSLSIEKIWLEKMWYYGRNKSEPSIEKDYSQLVIKIRNIVPDSLQKVIYFQTGKNIKEVCGIYDDNFSVIKFLPQQVPDTLQFEIYKIDDVFDNHTKFQKFGSMEIITKD